MNDWNVLKEISNDAYEFLKCFDPLNYDDGRYDLNNGMYINIESYTTHLRQERKFEVHKKYIDVQYMISGKELITVCPVDKLVCVDVYDPNRDIAFYQNALIGIDKIITSGEFLILRPGEAHMPCICVDEQARVRKAVIKIPVRNT